MFEMNKKTVRWNENLILNEDPKWNGKPNSEQH